MSWPPDRYPRRGSVETLPSGHRALAGTRGLSAKRQYARVLNRDELTNGQWERLGALDPAERGFRSTLAWAGRVHLERVSEPPQGAE